MRRLRMLLIIAALSVLTLAGAGAAGAEPTPGPPAGPGSLPTGFPADLRKFIGNTTEFKAAWSSGPCKDRGGDIGAYINAAMANEDRLIYWSLTDERKKGLLHIGHVKKNGPGGGDLRVEADVEAGREPPKDLLPHVFPAGDRSYALPEPACGDDLKRWANPEWNTWGFSWARVPDKQSLTEMRKMAGAGKVPDKAWAAPCGGGLPANYCNHAFFVNCDQADSPSGDQQKCVAWNTHVAHLFAGTANWIDKNKSFTDRVDDVLRNAGVYAAGNAIVSAFSWIGGPIAAVVKFVADPQSVIDDWANATKASAVDLSGKVLRGLVAVGTFDPSQGWFLRWYALSTGIGIAVMGLMTLLALWRAASKGETAKTIAADLFGYLPAGVLLMLFAPLLAQLIVGAATAMSESIVHISGPDMGEMVTNLDHFSAKLTAPALAGGAIVGLILFLLLIAGSLAVFFGLLMHAVALPALAIASGIGFGMWVHPKWRTKALRPVLLFIGLVMSKPLLFLLLALETSVINAALTGQPAGQGNLGTLGQLCLVVVAFVVVGLAPWSLLRYAPLLPSRSDANGFGGHSNSLLAGAVGGLGANALSRRSSHGSSGSDTEPSTRRTDRRGGTDSGDPSWRTADRDDGRSPTEAHLGATMGSRRNDANSNAKTGDGDGDGGSSSGGIGRKLASGLGSGAGKGVAIAGATAAVAVPIA
ncbi:MAG: hypothetical protein HOQ24_09095, partial [Mycobacteriaceae bacterium]|nr:hypothetical protein [Mycobacteriaceae bacterium]